LHYTPQSIKFSNYCDIKNTEVPFFAEDLGVEQLIIDAQTAIPFLVLSADDHQTPSTSMIY